MSRRRGFNEGIVDRIRLRAVYRCMDCGLRWTVYAPALAFKKTKKAETFSEYIGFGDERGRALVQKVVVLVVLVVVMAAGYLQMQKKPLPKKIMVDATGKRLK